MNWAIIGSTGLFGRQLLSYLEELGERAQGFDRANLQLSEHPNKIAPQLEGFDVWVNCVGYTQVDRAELEINKANLVNGIYAGSLAQAAALAGSRFIQISTDYVFDGLSNSPYEAEKPVNPQTAYGKSKALGEQLVAESGAEYSIVRTAWLYGEYGQCFPKVIAEKLENHSVVRVVNDQVGQPTWTVDLAEKVYYLAKLEEMPRVINVVSSGNSTWADFAKEVAISIGRSPDSVEEISSEDYPTPAKRPAWSVLDNSNDFITPISDWRERWREAAPQVLRKLT